MSDQNRDSMKRRRFMTTGAACFGISIIPSVTTATGERRSGDSQQRPPTEQSPISFELVNGELQADIPELPAHRRVSQLNARGYNGNVGEVSVADLENVVDDLNEAQTAGMLEIYENGGQILITPTAQLEAEMGGRGATRTLTTHSSNCGKNDLSYSQTWSHATITIELDDDNTRELTRALGAGAAASTIGGIIISMTGVGAVPGWVAQAIGVIFGYYTIDLSTNNKGCGVEIDIYIQATVPIPVYDIDPQ